MRQFHPQTELCVTRYVEESRRHSRRSNGSSTNLASVHVTPSPCVSYFNTSHEYRWSSTTTAYGSSYDDEPYRRSSPLKRPRLNESLQSPQQLPVISFDAGSPQPSKQLYKVDTQHYVHPHHLCAGHGRTYDDTVCDAVVPSSCYSTGYASPTQSQATSQDWSSYTFPPPKSTRYPEKQTHSKVADEFEPFPLQTLENPLSPPKSCPQAQHELLLPTQHAELLLSSAALRPKKNHDIKVPTDEDPNDNSDVSVSPLPFELNNNFFAVHPPSSSPPPVDYLDAYEKDDVLCGKGGPVTWHPGNQFFRQLIKTHRLGYVLGNRREKMAVAESILEAIRSRGGRFRRESTSSDADGKPSVVWDEISPQKAYEKVCQSLREGASYQRRQWRLAQQRREERRKDDDDDDKKKKTKKGQGEEKPHLSRSTLCV